MPSASLGKDHKRTTSGNYRIPGSEHLRIYAKEAFATFVRLSRLIERGPRQPPTTAVSEMRRKRRGAEDKRGPAAQTRDSDGMLLWPDLWCLIGRQHIPDPATSYLGRLFHAKRCSALGTRSSAILHIQLGRTFTTLDRDAHQVSSRLPPSETLHIADNVAFLSEFFSAVQGSL